MITGSMERSPRSGAGLHHGGDTVQPGSADHDILVEMQRLPSGRFVVVSRGPVIEGCYTVRQEKEHAGRSGQ